MSFGWLTELAKYLRKGRLTFRHVQAERERRAEEAFQGSIRSNLDVAAASERSRSSASFLKGVFDV